MERSGKYFSAGNDKVKVGDFSGKASALRKIKKRGATFHRQLRDQNRWHMRKKCDFFDVFSSSKNLSNLTHEKALFWKIELT
jgi:hypothetical protein